MNTIQEKIKLTCYHCGDACENDSIHIQDKVFCCTGCKTVYEILNENSLCEYYDLEKRPGNKIDRKASQEYAFLDEESIQNSLLKFREGTTSGIRFYIPSVHCSSCIWLLENLHKIQPGITSSFIHFQKKELDIQFDHTQISLRKIAELLHTVGYPPLLTLDGKEVNRKKADKKLFYKIGIAGFCFGNIMLLSLPEYLSVFDDFTGSFKSFFTWLNLLLALPVFLYSASGYFSSALGAIRSKVINIDLPIALGLVAAFGQSVYEIVSGTGAGYLDSLTGLIFFLLIGKWYQNKTYEALSFERDYKSYFPLAATLLKEGREHYVPLHELKPGDIILLRNNEVIPADGIICEGEGNIDYSFVTGESVPVEKRKGARVFAGGRQKGTVIKIKVVSEVSESYLTQLWNKDTSKKEGPSPLSLFTNQVGKYFTIAVIAMSLAIYIFWSLGMGDSSRAIYAAVSVLIIFCPCTLALAIPFCFGNAMNLLGRKGFYLKNTETIERLADNKSIVFDKTGTLTCAGQSKVEFEGFLSKEETRCVKSLVKNSVHPYSKMLFACLAGEGELVPEYYEEQLAQGVAGKVNGLAIRVGGASWVGIPAGNQPAPDTSSRVFVSIDGTVKACFRFLNKYREGIFPLLQELRKSYDLHLLSGDNAAEKKNLEAFFPSANMHFSQGPSEKLRYIETLEHKHNTIMIGDGLNDAGALLKSNCGITVSENNGNFSPACDAILEADHLKDLPSFLAYARACVRTVRYSLLISLTYNFIGLWFAVQGVLKPLVAAILMPASSVSIVLFVTLLSNILAKKYKVR